jgi:peptide deformylase
MALLPIIEVPDPRLRTISTPVDTVDDALRDLIADMFDTMYDAPGIGLAAIQVGVPKRVIVMDLQEQEDDDGKAIREPRVFINPEIVDPSEEQNVYTEGCRPRPVCRCRAPRDLPGEVARRAGRGA